LRKPLNRPSQSKRWNVSANFMKLKTKLEGSHPTKENDAGKKTIPKLESLKVWLEAEHAKLSSKNELAIAIRYTTTRWSAMPRFAHDGQLEIENNIAERSIRPIALGKKNWMFAGSDNGGACAAAIYSLIETAKHNGLNAQRPTWLTC
jgi:transposase